MRVEVIFITLGEWNEPHKEKVAVTDRSLSQAGVEVLGFYWTLGRYDS